MSHLFSLGVALDSIIHLNKKMGISGISPFFVLFSIDSHDILWYDKSV